LGDVLDIASWLVIPNDIIPRHDCLVRFVSPRV
jgi:hypothetical protein